MYKYYVEIKRQLDATDDFYCRSYCLLNMFRAPLCPCSRVLYKWLLPVIFDAWFSSCRYGVELRVMCLVCSPQTGHITLSMGIMVPETCWASNKICSNYHLLHLVGILFPNNFVLPFQLTVGSLFPLLLKFFWYKRQVSKKCDMNISKLSTFFFYSPTDAQVNCLENNLKIYIKIYIKTVPTCFGAVTPSSGSVLFLLARIMRSLF